MTRYPHEVLARLRRISFIVLVVVYALGMSASLYYVAPERLAADAAQGIHIVPEGGLRVETRPSGAAIRVGARQIGRTPVVDPELKPGRSSITIELAGYHPWRGMIDVPSREYLETGVVPMVPRLPDREQMSVEPGNSYPVSGHAPVIAHIPTTENGIEVVESGVGVRSIPDVIVDSVATNPASDTLMIIGRRDAQRVVVGLDQGTVGLRVYSFAMSPETGIPAHLVPVRFSATTDTIIAFTPNAGLSISEDGIEHHQLWSGTLISWGAPDGDWSALTEDGTLIRYSMGVVRRSGNFAPLPQDVRGSTIVGLTNDHLLLRTEAGDLIQLARGGKHTTIAGSVVDSARVGEDLVLAFRDSIAVVDDEGEIRGRLSITGDSVESLVGISNTGLVVFATAQSIAAVPLAAIRTANFTVTPVMIARLAQDEYAIGIVDETLIYGSDRQLVWQSLSQQRISTTDDRLLTISGQS